MKSALTAAIEAPQLTAAAVQQALHLIFSGDATDAQIGAFLTALRMRGEGAVELAAAAKAMREYCVPVHVSPRSVLLDTCGTGGDGRSTFNISTAAALVLAGCDIPIAKHGNRAATSKSGSADVLEALGVRVELSPEHVARCIEQVGIGFMFARTHHPAMRHVARVRAELGVRTIFNLLGPLSNPAFATHQVVGVANERLLMPFAHALSALGSKHSWVVHGHGGIDEIALTGPTRVVELNERGVREFVVQPEDFGLSRDLGDDIVVDSAQQSAAVIRAVLRGERGRARDVVVLNAAAGLMVAGAAGTFTDAAQRASAAIDGGAALSKLTSWASFTQHMSLESKVAS
jgi:anthranilate phosphoribosyltransferase